MKIQNSKFKIQNSNRGQAALVAVLLFVVIMTIGALGLSSFALGQAQIAKINLHGKQTYFLVEAGQEDVVYRLKMGLTVGNEETLTLLGGIATTTYANNGLLLDIVSLGGINKNIRKIKSSISASDEAHFNYGVQVGSGGIVMQNTSSVKGNLFSAGSVIAQQDNFIYGDIISAGPAGFVSGVHATGTVYAHTIEDSFIERDAHYQTISGTTVLGTLYPGSDDIPTQPLPISDETIAEWEAAAEAGGGIASPCPYVIKNDTTLGPVKISCDLEIQQNPYITLEGPVWVSGNVIIRNTPTIAVSPSLLNSSVAIIADEPGNQLLGSKIDSDNQGFFEGSGSPNSYVMLLSQNRSAEEGGLEKAIKVANTAQGDLLVYASHGEVELQNNIELREITAYKILIKNSAQIIYETGLAKALFSEGPGGSYDILDWKEIE